jgi:hypothetical protein
MNLTEEFDNVDLLDSSFSDDSEWESNNTKIEALSRRWDIPKMVHIYENIPKPENMI